MNMINEITIKIKKDKADELVEILTKLMEQNYIPRWLSNKKRAQIMDLIQKTKNAPQTIRF